MSVKVIYRNLLLTITNDHCQDNSRKENVILDKNNFDQSGNSPVTRINENLKVLSTVKMETEVSCPNILTILKVCFHIILKSYIRSSVQI